MRLSIEELKTISEEYDKKKQAYEERVTKRFNDVVTKDLMIDYRETEYCILHDDWGDID